MLSQWCLTDDEYYRIVITKYDGIIAILKSMEVFRDSSDVQALCCQCLAHLSKTKVVENNGQRMLVQAMEAHPTDPHVQSNALEAIRGILPVLVMKMKPPSSKATTEEGEYGEQDDTRDALDNIRRVSASYLSPSSQRDLCDHIIAVTPNGKAAATDIMNVIDALLIW